jgi:hypothetical protein
MGSKCGDPVVAKWRVFVVDDLYGSVSHWGLGYVALTSQTKGRASVEEKEESEIK